jgi:hypothetical protein
VSQAWAIFSKVMTGKRSKTKGFKLFPSSLLLGAGAQATDPWYFLRYYGRD